MSERPDIGRMIEEELSGGDAPEHDPATPIEASEFTDHRTPADRISDRQRVRESATEEVAAKAATPETETKEAKVALDRERKDLAKDFTGLREQVLAAGEGADEASKRALEARKEEVVRKMVELTSRGDAKLSTSILKEGVAVATDKDVHIFGAGLRSITEKVMQQGDFRGQLDNLLRLQPDAEAAIKGLTKNLDRRVEQIAKATEQKSRMYQGSRRETASERPAAVKEASKGKPASGEAQQKKALHKAMTPFFDDVRKMMERPTPKAAEQPKKEAAKKRSFWDRLTGKKAA